MAINFANGGSEFFTKPPRQIVVVDTRDGCPANTGSDRLMTVTFSIATPAVVSVQSQIIRRRSSPQRCDTQLYGVGTPSVNGDTTTGTVVLMRFLSFNDQNTGEWDTHYNCWMGVVPAGTHSFYVDNVTGGCTNFYGCTSPWGQMNIMIFE